MKLIVSQGNPCNADAPMLRIIRSENRKMNFHGKLCCSRNCKGIITHGHFVPGSINTVLTFFWLEN